MACSSTADNAAKSGPFSKDDSAPDHDYACVCCNACIRKFLDESCSTSSSSKVDVDVNDTSSKLDSSNFSKIGNVSSSIFVSSSSPRIGTDINDNPLKSGSRSLQEHASEFDYPVHSSTFGNGIKRSSEPVFKNGYILESPSTPASPVGGQNQEIYNHDNREGGNFGIQVIDGLPTKPPLCPYHNELIKHYCRTCNLSVCSSCLKLNHGNKEHCIDTVSSAHRLKRDEMKKILKQMDSDTIDCEQSIHELMKLRRQIQLSVTIQEGTIEKHVELAIAQINKEALILRFILREKEQLRIAKINREITRLQELADEITRIKNAAQKTMVKTQNHEYIEAHEKLMERMQSSLGRDTIGDVDRNSIIGMNKCALDVPFIVEVRPMELLQIRKCHLKRVQEFGDHKGSCDIASAPNGSLVVCDRHAKQLLLYSQTRNTRFKKQSNLFLSTKNSQRGSYGVAVSGKGKTLVTRSNLVEVYSSSGKYEDVLSIQTTDKPDGVYVGAYAIKVTSEDEIIVADREKCIITLLTQDGTVVKSINTNIMPHRLAVLPHKHIALSDWKHGKVSIISLQSGQTIRTFDIPNAKGICYHKESDCILVGRYLHVTEDGTPMAGTGVVEQYCCTSGRFVACIADHLCCPQNIIITQDGLLAVADYKTIKIYKIN